MATDSEKDRKRLVEEVRALRSKLARLERVEVDQAEQTPPGDILKQSEQFYRSVIEQAAECIALHDLEGRIEVVNPALCESLGYTEQELLGMNVSDIDSNVIAQDHPRRYWDSLPLEKTLSFESELRRKDGTIFPVEIRLRLVEMNGHKHILASSRDITDRKKAEQERLAHLQFLESLDKINRAIQSAGNIDQMMTDVLEAVLSTFDCDRAWLFYPCDPNAPSWKVPMERTKPQYPGAMALGVDIPMQGDVAQVLRTVLKVSGPVKFGPGSEYPLPSQAAERFNYQSQIAMALYPKLHQPWMFGLHQCSYPRTWIPEEERLFQAIGRRIADALTSLLILRDLQQSEQQYRAMFEQAVDSVVLTDSDTGQILEFNDKACQNLDYTRQEFEKLKLSDIEAVESPEEIIWHLDKMAKEGMGVFETRHRTKSGQIRDILVSAKIISIHGSKLAQGIFRDITDQKRATEKLNEYQTKLKSMAVTSLLNEERERLRIARGLHDDIGQKLAIAKLDLLSSLQGDAGHDTAESVKTVCSEIDTMIESVRSLTFELSNPVLAELGLEAAIERHLIREIRKKHDIEFQLNKCERLAQLDEDISMCLFRSVRELLNNVVKHAHAEKVSVSLDKTDGNITIRVNDDGVGFDPIAVASNINAGGGFGLFSVREQLESFEGKLKVESRAGRGSSFTITVPLPQKTDKTA